MPLMFLVIFITISAATDMYIYKSGISVLRSRQAKKRYLYGVGVLWFLTIGFPVFMRLAGDPAMMRFYLVLLIVFIFIQISKIIFCALSIIGRALKAPKIFHIASVVMIAALGAIVIYGSTSGRSRIRTERVEVASERIPEGFDGFTIAFFSDLHTANNFNRYRLTERMVDTINGLDADIVVNGGDIVNIDHRELDGRLLEILSRIHSREGVFSVMGNHDLGVYIHDTSMISEDCNVRRLIEKQESIGWKFMRNENRVLKRGDDSIIITGLDFPGELIMASHRRLTEPDVFDTVYDTFPHGAYNITLSHTQQPWKHLAETGRCDLMLSGHVHGMQMKIKIGGRVWSPAMLFYEQWSGLYTENGRSLYINDGIGCIMVPMRLWCNPEVTLITLRRI